MLTIRDVLKGISDTLENLLAFALLSLFWWLAVVLVLPAPGAAIALLAATDPRIVNATDRAGFREAIDLTGYFLRRGWLLSLLALPLLGILMFNLWSYRDELGLAAALAPLWTVLMVAIVAIGASALASIALFDDGTSAGIRQACGMVARRPLAALVTLMLLVLLLLLSVLLVVPVFLFYPAMAGAIVNRFVLRTLSIAVPDPLNPTAERRAEENREKTARRFGP